MLDQIQGAIEKSEIGHSGQIRFVIETTLSPFALIHGQSPKQRALEVFSLMNVWDTENNNGVLIYLLMADHDFEIIADRGLHQKLGDIFWQKVCKEMESHLRKGDFLEGVLIGITRIDEVLRQHYPASVITPNELPDSPVIL